MAEIPRVRIFVSWMIHGHSVSHSVSARTYNTDDDDGNSVARVGFPFFNHRPFVSINRNVARLEHPRLVDENHHYQPKKREKPVNVHGFPRKRQNERYIFRGGGGGGGLERARVLMKTPQGPPSVR